MIDIKSLANQAQKFTIDNSPLILTAIGTAGVVATAVLTGKGAFKAAQIIEDHEAGLRARREIYKTAETLSPAQKLALTWQCYIPACGVGFVTIASVIGANQIGTRRAAALAAAFTLAEKGAAEYKDKVQELIGEKKEGTVRENVAKDRILEDPPNEDNVIVVMSNGTLFQDSWSGRYFQSNRESVAQAVNELNHQLNIHGHATLTDFYELLGLPKTRQSDEIGWNTDQLLDVFYTPVFHDDGKRPVTAIDYRVVPSRDYFRVR